MEGVKVLPVFGTACSASPSRKTPSPTCCAGLASRSLWRRKTSRRTCAPARSSSRTKRARVNKQTWWRWTFGCATAVYHVIAPTHGKCEAIDFLRGTRPKVCLSDRYGGQRDLAHAHQHCLAHLIRDARYAIDHGDDVFASAALSMQSAFAPA